MARNTTTNTAPVAAKVAPLFAETVGKFTFEVTVGPAIPAEDAAARVRDRLPIYNLFSKLPHNGHFFVPHAFWTAPKEEGGRAMKDPSKFSPQYARGKINDSFKQWLKNADSEGRKDWRLVFRKRVAGDDNGAGGTFEADGYSVWMIDPNHDGA